MLADGNADGIGGGVIFGEGVEGARVDGINSDVRAIEFPLGQAHTFPRVEAEAAVAVTHAGGEGAGIPEEIFAAGHAGGEAGDLGEGGFGVDNASGDVVALHVEVDSLALLDEGGGFVCGSVGGGWLRLGDGFSRLLAVVLKRRDAYIEFVAVESFLEGGRDRRGESRWMKRRLASGGEAEDCDTHAGGYLVDELGHALAHDGLGCDRRVHGVEEQHIQREAGRRGAVVGECVGREDGRGSVIGRFLVGAVLAEAAREDWPAVLEHGEVVHWVRPWTGLPFASVTLTSTTTSRV